MSLDEDIDIVREFLYDCNADEQTKLALTRLEEFALRARNHLFYDPRTEREELS